MSCALARGRCQQAESGDQRGDGAQAPEKAGHGANRQCLHGLTILERSVSDGLGTAIVERPYHKTSGGAKLWRTAHGGPEREKAGPPGAGF